MQGMPRGLSLAAAAVLHAIAARRRHGFDVIADTGLASGTVYPALRRLEAAGYVGSSWEPAAIAQRELRPPRRYYRITPAGTAALEAARDRYRLLPSLQPRLARRGPR